MFETNGIPKPVEKLFRAFEEGSTIITDLLLEFGDMIGTKYREMPTQGRCAFAS